MTPRTLAISRPRYVLVQPPRDGHVHVCEEETYSETGYALCDRPVGESWPILSIYALRGCARQRTTCADCRKLLAGPLAQRRKESA